MASSGNFAVNNILIRPVGSTGRKSTHGNTTITSSSGSWGAPTTLAANTGKWYIEYYVNTGSSGRNVGVVPTNSQKYNDGDYTQGAAGDYAITINSGGSIYNNGSVTQSVASNMASGDIMGIAMDLDASPKTVQFYKNNSTIGSAENINSSATGPYAFMVKGHNQSTVTINAGQDSSFAGAKTSGSANAADDNGFGDFYYSPPSGFLALCSANLPISDDIDPAQTDDDYPAKQFGVVTYTGNATTGQAITGLGLQPDLIWAKCRSHAQSNFLSDTSRGINKFLFSDQTAAEGSGGGYATVYSSFDSDGFTLGTSGSGPNDNGRTYVAWGWRANGGTTASNTDGSITSTVQANTKAGFSIITYTGTGSNATIGHGLSAKPDFFTIKNRDGGTGMAWATYHSVLGATKYLEIDASDQAYTGSTRFNDTEPTTSTISIGTISLVNNSGDDFVCYAWHSVEGYSKFGKYEGNGNADGPFIYTGFRPRLIFFKRTDSGSGWTVVDTSRYIHNTSNGPGRLEWNLSNAETTGSSALREMDVLSNGIKIRSSNSNINTSGGDYVFGAWADVPFKYNNTF